MADVAEELRRRAKAMRKALYIQDAECMERAANLIVQLRARDVAENVGVNLAPVPGLSHVNPAPHAAPPAVPSGGYSVMKAGGSE